MDAYLAHNQRVANAAAFYAAIACATQTVITALEKGEMTEARTALLKNLRELADHQMQIALAFLCWPVLVPRTP